MLGDNEMTKVADESVGYIDEQDPSIGELTGFHIQDIETADWCLSRVAALEREVEENEAMEKFSEAARILVVGLSSSGLRPYLRAHGLLSQLEAAEGALREWEQLEPGTPGFL